MQTVIYGAKAITITMRYYKETQTGKLRYKKVKLVKMIEGGKGIIGSANFEFLNKFFEFFLNSLNSLKSSLK